MIFYQIQAAHNIYYLPTLLSMIYDDENFYLITVDKTQIAAANDLRKSFVKFTNVAVTSEYCITWGGFSQVESTILGMKYALRFPNLQYYINLSDSDLPLWTQQKIKEFFNNSTVSRHFVYIQHWRPEIDLDELNVSNAAGSSNLEHRGDIRFEVDNSIRKYFENVETSPIMLPRLRVLLTSREQADTKTLRISPLDPERKQRRSQFFKNFALYIGRQWFAAHLDVLRFVLSHPKFFEFYEILMDVFIPDEMFFQTIILNLVKNKTIIVNDNLRFRRGDPAELSDRNLDEVFASPAAFARKLDFHNAEQLLTSSKARFSREIEAFDAINRGLAASERAKRADPLPPLSLPGETAQAPDCMQLTRLANVYGSDKGSAEAFRHRYTFLYDLLFAPLRWSNIAFLELGLARGGPETAEGGIDRRVGSPSIQMWLDYFSDAQIVGADISDFSHIQHPRFKFVWADLGNQADYERIRGAAPRFDVIIDDASHASPHQQLAFRCLFEKLSAGGLYIIEDLHWQSPVYEATAAQIPKSAEFFISYFEHGVYLQNAILDVAFMSSVAKDVSVFSYFPDFSGLPSGPKLIVFRKRETPAPARASSIAHTTGTKIGGCRSFDLFDTLLTRRCVHPHRVIEEVERRAGIPDFCRLRLGLERTLFDRGEYTFHQIYQRLGDELGLSADEVSRLEALELAVERENFIQIREHCLEVGRNDIVVSDMYLPREFLEEVLREVCGIEGRPLYLSSHGKRHGTVWAQVSRTHDVIEHVGDDPTTDEVSARAAAIPSRLTSVARRSNTETELADCGFIPLANLIREARLSTWHPEPALRRAQLAQLELNLPLLFFATAHLLQKASQRGWQKILFSARDCYLWSRLYQSLSENGACDLSAAYFYTSRIARSRSSEDYTQYFNSLRAGAKTVVVDLCGTGWSAARLAEHAGAADTEFFLVHYLDVASLRQAYEDFAKTSLSVPISSMLRRSAERQDNDVFEELNRAPHRMVADVVRQESGYQPVYCGEHYLGQAALIFAAHQEALLLACQKFRHIPRDELRAMLEMNVEDQFVRLYKRLPELIDDLTPLLAAKRAEEDLVWPALKATG